MAARERQFRDERYTPDRKTRSVSRSLPQVAQNIVCRR
jgi:hypothetical protein